MPLITRWLAACAVGWLCLQPAAAQDSAADAEALLQQGDYAAAVQLATALTDAAPNDASLLVLLGRAQVAAGAPAVAQQTARRAWRAARGQPDLRFDAARLGARAAADAQRYGVAKLWLRLAADTAQTDSQRAVVAESFAAIRQRDRSETQLSFSVAPSSNINGGSSAQRLIVDGISTPLLLSGDARALSGIEARLDIAHRWRLPSTGTGTTFVGLRLAGSTYALSDAARTQAPDLRGADLGSALLEASITRRIPVSRGDLRYRATLGQLWYGGKRHSVRLRFDTALSRVFSPVSSGSLSAVIEGRDYNGAAVQSLAVSFSGEIERQLQFGRIESSLTLTRVFSPDRRSEAYTGAALAVRFAPRLADRVIEPSVALSASVNKFDSALGNIFGNDGRTDRRIAIDLRLDLPRAERFGFVPSITITAGRTWSNISRFDGDELAATLGLTSQF
jgi:hypothetical protein